jgi:hypothetical protein
MALINPIAKMIYFLLAVLKFLMSMSPSVIVFSASILVVTCVSAEIIYDMTSREMTREIEIKQGKLIGLMLELTSHTNLKPVEVFLGIPYAAAPTGSHRFMPPGSPPQWMGVKSAHSFGPVCPQNLPNMNGKSRNSMSEGRIRYLNRLLPYLLHNQSEDCLYLNIYAPAQKRGEYRNRISRCFRYSFVEISRLCRLPVLVFRNCRLFQLISSR